VIHMLRLSMEPIAGIDVQAIRFGPELARLSLAVTGLIGNAITTSPTGAARTKSWRLAVASAAKQSRGNECWDSQHLYAITLAFAFHKPSHGNMILDVENFLKPTIDALAAGLFCTNEHDLAATPRWGYDDSNFSHLLIHRLTDTEHASQESVRIFVSTSMR
jgi:hypothetical protein